jgi:hypothetical protein
MALLRSIAQRPPTITALEPRRAEFFDIVRDELGARLVRREATP